MPIEAGDMGLIPGSEDPLKEGMATQSSVFAWRIPWTGESGGLQSIGVTKCWTRLKRLSVHTHRGLLWGRRESPVEIQNLDHPGFCRWLTQPALDIVRWAGFCVGRWPVFSVPGGAAPWPAGGGEGGAFSDLRGDSWHLRSGRDGAPGACTHRVG